MATRAKSNGFAEVRPATIMASNCRRERPGLGEARVKVAVSGVNPTDWKSRRGSRGPLAFPELVPNQDGAGIIEAVGEDVNAARIGERVWIWEAAWQRANGTAQEYVALPSRQAATLPDSASFDLGASLGIPALTAHRCLTAYEGSNGRLAEQSLAARTVLVAGGAGAVGNAAIQLARWAGATVITTVSGPAKAALARAAGAHVVINYRTEDAAAVIQSEAPGGRRPCRRGRAERERGTQSRRTGTRRHRRCVRHRRLG